MLLPLLRAIVAIANLCLIAATRNLWFGDSGFPMIPLVGGLTDVPLWIDNALSTLLVSALLLLTGVSICDFVRIRRITGWQRTSCDALPPPRGRNAHDTRVSGEDATPDENHAQPEQPAPARSSQPSENASASTQLLSPALREGRGLSRGEGLHNSSDCWQHGRESRNGRPQSTHDDSHTTRGVPLQTLSAAETATLPQAGEWNAECRDHDAPCVDTNAMQTRELTSSETAAPARRQTSCGKSSSLRIVRLACVLIVACGTSLALLNQHRLQPWLYHLMLLCPILALDGRQSRELTPRRTLLSLVGLTRSISGVVEFARIPRCSADSGNSGEFHYDEPTRTESLESLGLVVLLTASIYFWSGISKCDRAFIEGHGQTFVSAIANVLGVSLKFWSPEQRSLAAAVLPVGELLVAISLLIPKTRRIGLFASLLMHGLLITAVGPWGMDQRPGVLLWNVLFISQNVLLLRYLSRQRIRSGTGQQLAPAVATPCATGLVSASPEPSREKTSGTPSSHPAEQLETNRSLQFARCVVIAAALAPLLRFVGWFDNWPSWAVYTAGNEHAYVLIAENSVDRLPPDIRRFVQPRAMNDGWLWLRIDLWSIAAVDAPLYPQKRFSAACGLAMSKLPGMQDSIRILTESSADPLTGERTTKSYASHAELQQLAAEFTLNLQPRSATR